MISTQILEEKLNELKKVRAEIDGHGTRFDMQRERLSKDIADCDWALQILRHEDAKVRRLANMIRRLGG